MHGTICELTITCQVHSFASQAKKTFQQKVQAVVVHASACTLGHDSSESLRAASAPVLEALASGQGQSLTAPDEVREQAQLARGFQEDVAKAKDSLREGQAAMVSLSSALKGCFWS